MAKTENARLNIYINSNAANDSMKSLTDEARKLRNEWAKLDPTSKQAIDTMKKIQLVEGRVKSLRDEVNGFGGAMGNLKKQFSQIGSVAVGSLLGGGIAGAFSMIRGEISRVIDVNREFEKSLNNLQAITGVSRKELNFYKDAAREMGRTTSASATDSVEAMKLIASAKPDLLNAKEALVAVTKEAIHLSNASGLELPEAAKRLTEVMNQFNAPARDAGKYINVMAEAARLSTAEIPDLSDSLLKSGIAAKNMGLDLASASANVEVLAEKGLMGAEAGTQLRNIYLKLQSGMDEFNPSVVGMNKALENLANAHLSAAEMAKMFGVENITGATILIENRNRVEELSSALGKDGLASAYDQARINTDNLDGDIKRLNRTISDIELEAGNSETALNKMFRASVSGLESLIGGLWGIARDTGELFTKRFWGVFSQRGSEAEAYLDQVEAQKNRIKSFTVEVTKYSKDQLEVALSQNSQQAALLIKQKDTITKEIKTLESKNRTFEENQLLKKKKLQVDETNLLINEYTGRVNIVKDNLKQIADSEKQASEQHLKDVQHMSEEELKILALKGDKAAKMEIQLRKIKDRADKKTADEKKAEREATEFKNNTAKLMQELSDIKAKSIADDEEREKAIEVSKYNRRKKEIEDTKADEKVKIQLLESLRIEHEQKIAAITTEYSDKRNKEALKKEKADLESQFADEIDIVSSALAQKQITEKEYEAYMKQTQINHYVDLLEIQKKYGEDTVDTEKKIAELKAKAIASNATNTDAVKNKKRNPKRGERFTNENGVEEVFNPVTTQEYADLTVSIVRDSMNQIQQIKDLQHQAEIDRLNKELDTKLSSLDKAKAKELSNKELTEAQREAINRKYELRAEKEKAKYLKLEQAEKMKQWEQNKKIAMSQAVIDGALAQLKVWSTYAWPTGIPFAIGAAVATGLQIKTIQSQPKPFAYGGFADTPTYGVFGEAGPEAFIPLGADKRSRGIELWQETGKRLGVTESNWMNQKPRFASSTSLQGSINRTAGSVANSTSSSMNVSVDPGNIHQAADKMMQAANAMIAALNGGVRLDPQVLSRHVEEQRKIIKGNGNSRMHDGIVKDGKVYLTNKIL